MLLYRLILFMPNSQLTTRCSGEKMVGNCDFVLLEKDVIESRHSKAPKGPAQVGHFLERG